MLVIILLESGLKTTLKMVTDTEWRYWYSQHVSETCALWVKGSIPFSVIHL